MLVKPLILLTLFHFNSSAQFNELTQLIYDFVELQNEPTKITAYVCWRKQDLVQFSGTFLKYINFQMMNPKDERLVYSFPEEHQMLIMDLSCKGSKQVLMKAYQLNLINLPFRWVLWNAENFNFTSFFFGPGSRVYVIKQIDKKYFEIVSVYKLIAKDRDFVENNITQWSLGEGFKSFRGLIGSYNRTNLQGRNLTYSFVYTNPDTLKHWDDYRNKQIDPTPKVFYFLTHVLSDVINSTIDPIFRTTWGYKNATTGLYNGLIGDLQVGRAHIGGTPAFLTVDRFDIVDYYVLKCPVYFMFIFRKPPLSYVTNVYTLPFDTYVWYSCFVITGIVILAIYLIVVWEWRDPYFSALNDEYHEELQPPLRSRVFDVVMLEIGAITQQGSNEEPRSVSGRIATFFTLITLTFLYNAYSANIVALLQSTTDSIRTVDDLLTSRIKLGSEDIVYNRYYFEHITEPVRKAIYEQKIAPKGQEPNYFTLEVGVQRIRDEFFAFHVDPSSAYKLISDTFYENEKCGLKEIDFFNIVEPMPVAQKNSTYEEVFKIGLRKIEGSGIQRRAQKRIYTSKPLCLNPGSNFKSVGLIDLYAGFLIFGIGLALSCILLLFELFIKKYVEKRIERSPRLFR